MASRLNGTLMKKLKFLVSLITSDNDYQAEQASAAMEAGRRLGVEVEVIFADNDAINQSQQLLQVIQSRQLPYPDGILMEPAGATALPHVAQAAVSAGIGWVVLNREVDYIEKLRQAYKVPIFSLGADQEEVGRIQGRQFAALLPRGGSLLYIQGPSASSVSRQRASGMCETKPENIRVKVLKSATWMEGSGHQAVSSWLRLSTSREERIDLVGCQNDLIAIGARNAFGEAGGNERQLQLDLPFTGVDGLPKTGQEWVRRGLLAATVVVPPMTSIGLEMLVAAIRTGSPAPAAKLVEAISYPSVEELGMGQRRKPV